MTGHLLFSLSLYPSLCLSPSVRPPVSPSIRPALKPHHRDYRARFEIRSTPLSSDKSIGLKARFRATTAGHREFLCFSVYTNTGGSPLLIHGGRDQRITDRQRERENVGGERERVRERDSGNRWLDVSIKNSFRHTDRCVPIKGDWTRSRFWRYVILMFVIYCCLRLFWIRHV